MPVHLYINSTLIIIYLYWKEDYIGIGLLWRPVYITLYLYSVYQAIARQPNMWAKDIKSRKKLTGSVLAKQSTLIVFMFFFLFFPLWHYLHFWQIQNIKMMANIPKSLFHCFYLTLLPIKCIHLTRNSILLSVKNKRLILTGFHKSIAAMYRVTLSSCFCCLERKIANWNCTDQTSPWILEKCADLCSYFSSTVPVRSLDTLPHSEVLI